MASQSEAARRADAIRKQVPVMRSLLPVLPTLDLLGRSLADIDLEELDRIVDDLVLRECGRHLEKRGRGLVRMGLVGAFAGMEHES